MSNGFLPADKGVVNDGPTAQSPRPPHKLADHRFAGTRPARQGEHSAGNRNTGSPETGRCRKKVFTKEG